MATFVGGTMTVRVNGKQLKAKGAFTFNAGHDKRELVMGHDGPHGFKTIPQPSRIEGAITLDTANFPLAELAAVTDATVTIELASGDVFTLRDAAQTGELDVTTEEGEVSVAFHGMSADFA